MAFKKKFTAEDKAKKEQEYEERIANLFIKGMENNSMPWQKPWSPSTSTSDYNMFSMVKGGVQVSSYKGFNSILCELTRILEYNSEDPRWCTMLQLKNYNEKIEDPNEKVYVVKGSHGLPIKYFSFVYFDKDGNKIKIKDGKTPKEYDHYSRFLSTYNLFHASQLVKYRYDKDGKRLENEDGTPITVPAFEYKVPEITTSTFEPSDYVDKVIKNTGAIILHDSADSCGYIPSQDVIHMVKREQFKKAAEYYDTLLHELTHWTGHPDRLNREEAKRYSESDVWRAREELVAEIGGFLLAKECKVTFEPSNNNLAYVKSWIKELKEDPKAILKATHNAEKAVNYVLDFSKPKKDKE